jgi:hypothetical protein
MLGDRVESGAYRADRLLAAEPRIRDVDDRLGEHHAPRRVVVSRTHAR